MGGGSVKIPTKKLEIIGTYNSGGGSPKPKFLTVICLKFVYFSIFRPYNFGFVCPYHKGEGGWSDIHDIVPIFTVPISFQRVCVKQARDIVTIIAIC